MIPILLDADAFRCAKDLGVLDSLQRIAAERVRLYMTEYVARHELSSDAKTIEALCACGLLVIEKVPGKDVQKLLRESRDKRSGLHKGEAESIVWAKGLDRRDRPLFISNDRRARRGATQHGVRAGDLMDLLVEAVRGGVVELDEMKRLVSSKWDDREQQQCRPHDWDGFDSTFARRQAERK